MITRFLKRNHRREPVARHPQYGTNGVWVCGCLLLLTVPVTAQEFALEEGFTRLDNGKDLTGWVCPKDADKKGWSVEDGAIRLKASEAKSDLYSETTHSAHCIIRLEFKATPQADSGVYVHGKQLQVRDYPTAGPKNYAKPARPAGEWNALEFDITQGVAVVKLNGEVIEKQWRIGPDAKKGIGLQRERGDFAFRHIRIREKK